MTTEPLAPDARVLYGRVRDITKNLHDAMRELGHDKRIEASLGAVPDAKARLSFIARVTGEAAEKVLNTVDAAQARQETLAARALAIAEMLRDAPIDAQLRGELLQFAEEVRCDAQATCAQLTDIMLAQDFHDLTGQTVGKVVAVATSVEDALLQLLLETSPATVAVARGPLDGPVVDAATRTDVVANQAQVDDLLASLGF
jgi:chemotaxis protein CheZ